MSYRIQIDVYGDRIKDKEKDEKEEKRNDRILKGVILAFLLLIIVFYIRDMCTRIVVDGDRYYKVKGIGYTTKYTLKNDLADDNVLLVNGKKDRDETAVLTYPQRNVKFTIHFSNKTDWDNSEVTISNGEGEIIFTKQYQNGTDLKNRYTGSLFAYDNEKMVSAALREGIVFRGNIVLSILAMLLIIAEFLSFFLWKWVFARKNIKWAIDRGNAPSHLYMKIMRISRAVAFLLICYLMISSYSTFW